MKFKTLISPLFFVASAFYFLSVDTYSQDTKPAVRRTATFHGGSWAYKLTDRDFADTPSWNQDEGEPPLSVSRAVKVARENLPRFVKNAESWKMRMVTLQSMGEEKWYYRIHFFCSGAACREIEDRVFTAIVKFDGTIVEPKKVTIEQ